MKSYFLKESGEKTTVNKKNVITLLGVVLCLGLTYYLTLEIFSHDSSILIKTSEPPKVEQNAPQPEIENKALNYPLLQNSEMPLPKPSPKRVIKEILKLKATQIIDLSGAANDIQTNTFGATIRVRLLNDIDTREPDEICKVMIIDNTISDIPAKTLLFGKATLGGSKRVLIKFDRALLPSGEEADLLAQAVDAKTNKAGVEGEFYGRNGLRAVGSMSLNMISGISETLTQKESLGGFQGQVTNKPNLKNAVFNGIAKTSEQEAVRQSENLNRLPEYAEVKQGSIFAIQILEKVRFDR